MILFKSYVSKTFSDLSISVPKDGKLSATKTQHEYGNECERNQVEQSRLSDCHQVETGKGHH